MMDKEDLMRTVVRFEEEVKERLESVRKDIAFNSDLVLLKEKHKKFAGETSKEISELKIRQSTLEDILDSFKDIMEDEDIDIEAIRKNV